MDLGLNGKRALVLGASRGLGAAIADTLADEGASVIAAARNGAAIEKRAEKLKGELHALELDLADAEAIDQALNDILVEGGIDILVNNSGGPPPGAAAETDRADWIKYFDSMAANIFHITQRILPGMRESGWGRVITLTSSGVAQPIPNLALSNGIRSALVGWSKTLSNEVAQDGVTVNVVMPGRIHTDRVDQLDAAAAKRSGKAVAEVAASSAAAIPAGRYGDPQEFADVVAFLASERASYVTGTCIRIDGGAIKGI